MPRSFDRPFDPETLQFQFDVDVLRTWGTPVMLETPFPVQPRWMVASGFYVTVIFDRGPEPISGTRFGTRFAFVDGEALTRHHRGGGHTRLDLQNVHGELVQIPHVRGMGRPEGFDLYCWVWTTEEPRQAMPPATEEPPRRRISFGE